MIKQIKTSFFFFIISILTLQAQDSTKVKQEKIKEHKIEVVVIKEERKAIEQKADRTIFNLAGQADLNNGTLMDAMKQLPGLITSDVAGMMYQGKQLQVYMDGRPLNISSLELTAFLEGLPASSVDRIEVITQPGAEFSATSGGALLNIITNKNAKKYLSATISNATNFTNYDKLRWRTNSSILLNAKNKYFGWQINMGQAYRESANWNEFSNASNNTVLTNNFTDRLNRNQYFKSGLTFDLGRDKMLLNYDFFLNSGKSDIEAFGLGFTSNDKNQTSGTRQNAGLIYQKRFRDRDQKLDFLIYNSINENKFDLFNLDLNSKVIQTESNQGYFNAKIDYNQLINFLDESKISTGFWFDELKFDTENFGVKNLDYSRVTKAAYLEFQSTYKKFDFIAGIRTEDYKITGKAGEKDLIPFNQLNWFPNASMQFNFNSKMFFSLNYNRKITLPSTSALNPNNTVYQNQNIINNGNANLNPTIFNNFEAKISAFDYAYISYSQSIIDNQVAQFISLNSNQVQSTQVNIPNMKIHNFNFAFPLPYMLFTKGLKETMKFNFNPDKINFLYIITGYQLHNLPDVNTKGYWTVNLISQIILPKSIKFKTEYSVVQPNGNLYYFVAQKAYNNSINFSFSKKFLGDKLSVSIFVDDAFNMNRSYFSPINESLLSYNKFDTRRFGFSVTYKITTKNKLAKIEPNRLREVKEEEN